MAVKSHHNLLIYLLHLVSGIIIINTLFKIDRKKMKIHNENL